MLQNATPLRKSAPGPPNSSDEHVSCTAPAKRKTSCQILFKCPTPAIVFVKCYKTLTCCSLLTKATIPCACHAKRHLNVQKWSEHVVFLTFWLQNLLRATTACIFSTSQLPKVVRTRGVFNISTSKHASRHNGVHFFNIATSKSDPTLRCSVHFDFEMCFAPQRRALFRHRNFQKWSGAEVFCTFWLGNVLRATTACTFSSLIWPDASAPAALASLLFDPPEPQIIGKTQWIATFLPFRASASSFFWSFLFWLFSPLLFNCPYCRKFHF